MHPPRIDVLTSNESTRFGSRIGDGDEDGDGDGDEDGDGDGDEGGDGDGDVPTVSPLHGSSISEEFLSLSELQMHRAKRRPSCQGIGEGLLHIRMWFIVVEDKRNGLIVQRHNEQQ